MRSRPWAKYTYDSAQLGLRRLTDYDRKLLIGKKYELEKKLHRGDKKSKNLKKNQSVKMTE